MASETIGSKLTALRERSGLSLSSVAKAGKYRGPSSIQRYFSEDYDPEFLPRDLADRLKEALVGFGDPPIAADDVERLTEYGFMFDRKAPVRLPLSALQRSPRNHIECNASYPFPAPDFGDIELFHIANDPLRAFVRPEHLVRRPIDAFFVSTSGMMPRYNPGEIVFVERERPASIGDDVLVNIQTGEEGEVGLLATLKARERARVIVSVLNPYDEIEILQDQIDAISPILKASDLLMLDHT